MGKKLGIIGGGRFSRLARSLALDTHEFTDIAIFDDHLPTGTEGVSGKITELDQFIDQGKITHLTVAIGYKHYDFRQEVYERFKGQVPFATLIHPSAFVSKEAELDEGVSVYSMSNIETGAQLAANVTIFNQTCITHDINIGAHSFLSVGVAMGGGVQIGERSFLGVNATVVNDIEIGKNCIVCGGTFLTKSIADEVCVIGNPYREIDRVYL